MKILEIDDEIVTSSDAHAHIDIRDPSVEPEDKRSFSENNFAGAASPTRFATFRDSWACRRHAT